MIWNVILKDGSRHPVSGHIHFEVVRETKRISASSIDGNSEALIKAFAEKEIVLESPHGHHHRAAVEMVDGHWRVVGL